WASLLRLSKNPSGRFGGPKPSKCNPHPATCAADAEALPCKVSLRCFPPGSPAGTRGKQRSTLGKGRRRRTFSTRCEGLLGKPALSLRAFGGTGVNVGLPPKPAWGFHSPNPSSFRAA